MRTLFFAVVASVSLLAIPLRAQDSKENSDFKLAVGLYNDRMYDLALEQFRQFANFYPNSQQSVEARYYIALSQLKLKKYDDARYSFQNFALSYPDNPKAPEAWMNVAEVYLALNNMREAALAFERVKTFNPKSKQAPIALLKASEYYTKTGDQGDAKRVLRVLTQEYTDPEVVLPAHLAYAELLLEDKDFEGVRSECRKVTEATKDPELRPRALLLTARAFEALEKSKEEESALNELVDGYKNSRSYPEALLLLGTLKQKSGNLPEAVATWQKLADDTAHAPVPVRQNALIALGEASSLEGNHQASLRSFERAGDLSAARTGEAWYRAGRTAERLGDLKLMARYYARAVNDTSSAFDRRLLLVGGIKGAGSEKDFVRAVRLSTEYETRFPEDPNVPRVMLHAADLCVKELKDFRKAIGLYQDILERFPENRYSDEAMFGLGNALHAAGDLEEAVSTFERLETRYPSSDLIDGARSEAKYITLFELKNKETGLEKLALLVGDVIAQQSKGDLAFRLAEIYFHDLKDYPHAITQYRLALQSGLEAVRRPTAWDNIALSYEYLNLKDKLARETGGGTENARYAIEAYDSLLAGYPESAPAEEAALARFALRLPMASGIEGLRKLASDFMKNDPNGRTRDRALLALGNSYAALKDLQDAALTYKLVLDQFPRSASVPEALFALGKSLLGLAERDSAARILSRFLEANPNQARSAEAAFLLAQYEASNAHPDAAVRYYDIIDKKYPYTNFAADLDRKRGDAWFDAQQYAQAAELYVRNIAESKVDVFSTGEISPDVLYKTAYAYEKSGNSIEAKRYYAQYITRTKDTDKLGLIYHSLATIAQREGNSELATRYLQESLRYAQPSSDLATSLSLEAADLLYQDAHYSDAIARYSQVEEHATNDSLRMALQARIVVCYYRLDNVKEGDKRSTTFAKAHPGSVQYAAEFEFERGNYLLRKNESEQALVRFEHVVREFPNAPVVPDALFWMGKAYEMGQKPDRAIAFYDSVITWYPKSDVVPRAELSLGNIYYNMEQWETAARHYKTLVDSESRAPDLLKYAMSNLALTFKQMKLYDAAMELDRKYIDRFPDDDDVISKKIDIAVLYQNLGFYDQSIAQIGALLDTGNPDIEAELRYYLGEGYFYKSSYQQAILEFLKVPYLVTKRGTADWISPSYYMAGQSYEKMSKFDLAMSMYKKIIDSRETATEFKTAAQREINRVQAILGK